MEPSSSPITSHQSRLTQGQKAVLGALAAGTLVVLFCFILLWHNPLVFWNDDYELSILPVFADVARSWNEGQWPLLSSYSWVCSNLAGEFQYGTFSIFVNAVVILIWKFPLTFARQAAALSITHLFVLGAGAFLLAKQRLTGTGAGTQSTTALSIFVALVASLNGWIICWGATDWFGALGAFAWLPWAWWSLEKSLNVPSAGKRRRRFLIAFVWPAPFVYLVVTGGFPYVVVMLAVLCVWLSIKSLVSTGRITSVLPMLLSVALGLGLSAPAWLALFDYVHGSAREAQPAAAHWQWIVPWSALPGFILPSWTVNWADFSTRMVPHPGTELACGLVAPVALLGGLLYGGRIFVRRISWELVLLLGILLLAMIPTAGVFRWSFRWLPFFHLTLALCAADALSSNAANGRNRFGLFALFLSGTAAVLTLLLHTAGPFAFPLAWILFGLAGLWFLCERWLRDGRVRQWTPAAFTFAAFLATYLCIPPNCGVPQYHLAPALNDSAPLDRARLYLSIYPWAESTYRIEKSPGPVGQVVRPGSTSMFAALRFINGYSPIRPAGVAREFKFAIHGEIDPDVGEYLLRDQSGVLAELGIDGLAIAGEVNTEPPASEWHLVFSNDEGRVYHRPGPAFATVRSVRWIDSIPDREFTPASISQISDLRNRVEADVEVRAGNESALLKFTRPYFPGYMAWLGGKELRVESYRGLLPIVEVPAGSHGRLVLAYRPAWLVYGGGFAILCAAAWLVAIVAAAVSGGRKRQHQNLPPETAAATN
jgi:hypothetical protein